LSSVSGFGCSDCICQSHLFYGSSQEVLRTIDFLGVTSYFPHTNP
jgi:Uri superfamily endonuclease